MQTAPACPPIHLLRSLSRFMVPVLAAVVLVASPAAAQFTQVTTSPARDRFPSWTADGQSIVFESNRTGGWHLFVVPATGGTAVQLTNEPLHQLEPAVSPDGTRIVFVRSADANPSSGAMHSSSICVMPIGGGPETQVTASSSYLDQYPTWSPDGQTIYFVRYVTASAPAIFSVPASGGQEAELVIAATTELCPLISPDGLKIAYAFKSSGAWQMGEALLSSSAVRIWDTNYGSTTVPTGYSPDGNNLVFVSRKDTGNLELYLRDLTNGNVTRITYDSSPSFDPATNMAHYSPDGTKIVFFSSRVSGNENIWIYDSVIPPAIRNHLVVGTGVGLPGGAVVHIPVNLDNADAVGGLEFNLQDVPDWLQVVSVAPAGRIGAGWSAAFTDGSPAHILLYSPTAKSLIAGTGMVLDIGVQISPAAVLGDSLDLVASTAILSDNMGAEIAADMAPGWISIERRPGDLNSDNLVDVGDIVRLVEIILGTGQPPSPEELALADCNGDAARNILDVPCLVQLGMTGAPLAPPALKPSNMTPSATLSDITVEADQAVNGIQLFLSPGSSEPLAGPGLEPFAMQTGVLPDGRAVVMAYDASGKTWDTGTRVPFRIDGTLLEARAYGPGGRPLHLEQTGTTIRIHSGVPPSFSVQPCAPNPFHTSTMLRFSTPVAGHVTINVFDVRGARVATLGTAMMAAGDHSVTWPAVDQSGRPLAAGFYIATITTAQGTKQVRMILTR